MLCLKNSGWPTRVGAYIESGPFNEFRVVDKWLTPPLSVARLQWPTRIDVSIEGVLSEGWPAFWSVENWRVGASIEADLGGGTEDFRSSRRVHIMCPSKELRVADTGFRGR